MTFAAIEEMPKLEMPVHLEGAIRKNTYVELRRIEEPSFNIEYAPWDDGTYRFNDLDHFLDTASTRIPVGEIVQAIRKGWNDSKTHGEIEYGVLVGIFRSDEPEAAFDLVKQAARAQENAVVGIDLLEHESSRDAAAYKQVYAFAGEADLGLRAHAGEGLGSQSVRDVIDALGVSRIAHGTRSIEDSDLVEYLADNRITLDMCPTSNYRLRVVESIDAHPIRKLFDAGVPITVSSDDPLFFGSNVTGELKLLAEVFGFTRAELVQLQKNAANGAFMSPENRKAIMAKLEQWMGSYE